MAKSDRWVNAGDQMPYIDRDRDRDKSNKNAQRKAGWYSDDAYRKELDKETIKRQQEKMRDAAEDGYQKKRVASSKKSAGAAKPTAKKTTRKRVAGK